VRRTGCHPRLLGVPARRRRARRDRAALGRRLVGPDHRLGTGEDELRTPTAAEPCSSGCTLEERHREHGETPLRVQEGKEAPDETEQKNREAKEHETQTDDEEIREGEQLKNEGKTPEGSG
jgi:hypothetical protein